MITPSPEDFSYLEVHRPIIGESAKRFIANVQNIGRLVLGEKVVSSRADWGLTGIDQLDDIEPSPHTVVTPVTQPIMEVSAAKDLRMVLMHRGVPAELASRYDIAFHALQLNRPVEKYETFADSEGDRYRAEKTLPPLKSVLNEVSERHKLNPAATQVVCDNICVMVEPGQDAILTLLPRATGTPTRVLHEQANECGQRLHKQSRRLAYPVSGSLVGMPFARLPHKVTDIQSDRVISNIQRLFPARFVMGEPRIKTDD